MQTHRTPIIDTLTLWTGSLQAALAAGAGAAILADLPNWVAFSIAVGLFVVGMVQAGLRWAAQNATVPVGDVVEIREGSDVGAGSRTTRWPKARSCANSAAALAIASPTDRPHDEAPPSSLQGSAGALSCVWVRPSGGRAVSRWSRQSWRRPASPGARQRAGGSLA